VKIGLTADLHLDKRLGHRADAAGVNLRSRDLERATSQVIDGFIREQVEVAVFAGDLFDNAKPSERTRQFLVGEIRRLQAALPDATIVLLRGNHDAAMSFSDATAIGTAALALPGVEVVDAYGATRIRRGELTLTAIPWARSDEEFIATIESLEPEPGRTNLLVLHCGLADLPEYAELRPGSQTITRSLVPAGFDAIFSGHFHKHRVFADLRFTFIGSPERLSVSEAGEEKAFLTYETTSGELHRHPISVRSWYDLPAIDASGWEANRVVEELEGLAAGIPDWSEALVRVRIANLDPLVYGALDIARVNRVRARAFHADIELRAADLFADARTPDGESDADAPLLDDLEAEWRRFVEVAIAERDAGERALLGELGSRALAGVPLEG
jgi:DNA repair exonuclease SbcCD nuclease subunit